MQNRYPEQSEGYIKPTDMDGLITVLIIAAAVIFKVVGKKFDSAAGDEVFPPIPFEPEDLPSAEEEEPVEAPKPRVVVKPQAVVKPAVSEKPFFEEAQRALPVKPVHAEPSVKKPQAPILEEETPQEREKIDPKKLVVYSEIMKPKYLEEN